MSYEEVNKITLPKYSNKEEEVNWISHAIGAIIGLIIFFICFGLALKYNKANYSMVGIVIYGISMMTLYSMSALYHVSKENTRKKRVRRIVDHCTIFILIAGTYTPVCLMGEINIYKIILLLIEWFFALIGISINAYNFNKLWVRIVSMILYLVLGWAIIFFPSIYNNLPFNSFIFILCGGIAYTIGSILYGIGHNVKWFHSVFHFFCLLGTILQAIGIIIIIM